MTDSPLHFLFLLNNAKTKSFFNRKTTVEVISALAKPYSWGQSFVTDDKSYCIHIAENKDDIRDHARSGNLPTNTIEEIKQIIDLPTAG